MNQRETKKSRERNPKLLDLTPEERRNLVGAFIWLIEQDKKQNPHLYKVKNNINQDK